MKKFLGIFLIMCIIAGCSETQSDSSYMIYTDITEPQTTAEIITEVVITKPSEEKLLSSSGKNYIYDNAKILLQEELTECNNYVSWINSKLMLNTAVVTTNNLEKLSPEQYAEKCYDDIFQGMGSGIILLINNDTNKDYIYKHGTPRLYIEEQAEKDAFFYATKSIVSGDYESGILELLSLAEDCPKHIFDNGQIFTYEQIVHIESTLAMRSDINAFIVTTNNITDKSNAELAKEFYERYSEDGQKCKMLFIDKELDEIVVTGDSGEKASDKMNQLIKQKDYYGVVKEYLKTIGIDTIQ